MADRKGGEMTVREAGRKGGIKVRDTYGPDFYQKIGQIGGEKGGNAVKRKYGVDFYKAIGARGGQTVKRLIEQGKRAQEGGARRGKT